MSPLRQHPSDLQLHLCVPDPPPECCCSLRYLILEEPQVVGFEAHYLRHHHLAAVEERLDVVLCENSLLGKEVVNVQGREVGWERRCAPVKGPNVTPEEIGQSGNGDVKSRRSLSSEAQSDGALV